MYSDRIGRAVQIAAIRHEHQYRKNPEKKIPYIAHPLAVGMMLMHYGYPEDVVIAGLLHDTVEDTGMTIAEIRKEFGDTVAALVAETSEADKGLPWEERKSRYIEHLQTASEEAKAISCCDKIHNMKSMIESLKAGGNIWRILKRGKRASDRAVHCHAGHLQELFGERDGRGRRISREDAGKLIRSFYGRYAAFMGHKFECVTCSLEGKYATVTLQGEWSGLVAGSMAPVSHNGVSELRMKKSPYGGYDVVRASIPGFVP